MYSSQKELNDNWTKVSYKRGRSKKELKEKPNTPKSEHWLNQASTSNRYTALLDEESEDKQQKACLENTPEPPPIYITDVKNS
jgi:hypothetical protein